MCSGPAAGGNGGAVLPDFRQDGARAGAGPGHEAEPRPPRRPGGVGRGTNSPLDCLSWPVARVTARGPRAGYRRWGHTGRPLASVGRASTAGSDSALLQRSILSSAPESPRPESPGRRAEAVDRERGVRVRQRAQRVPRQGWVFGPLKTSRERAVPLAPRALWAKERAAGRKPLRLVWRGRPGTRSRSRMCAHFVATAQVAGLPRRCVYRRGAVAGGGGASGACQPDGDSGGVHARAVSAGSGGCTGPGRAGGRPSQPRPAGRRPSCRCYWQPAIPPQGRET